MTHTIKWMSPKSTTIEEKTNYKGPPLNDSLFVEVYNESTPRVPRQQLPGADTVGEFVDDYRISSRVLKMV